MDFNEYQKGAAKTAVPSRSFHLNSAEFDLLHGAMGLCTEAGELQDNLKRAFFYGKAIDVPNIKEELGDSLWYIALICARMGWSMEDIAKMNSEKLKARFPEKFTEEKALNRDLETERNILEKGEQDEKDSNEENN